MQKKYAITATFVRTKPKSIPEVTIIGGKQVRQQKSAKTNVDGYRISEIFDIDETDPTKYTIGDEVKEFSYRIVYVDGVPVGVAPATADEEGAITVKYPFTTLEAVTFVRAYGEANGDRKEIHNARAVVRGNLNGSEVNYLAAVTTVIQSLLAPNLKEMIVDSNGILKPDFKEKFKRTTKNKKTKANSDARFVNAILTTLQ